MKVIMVISTAMIASWWVLSLLSQAQISLYLACTHFDIWLLIMMMMMMMKRLTSIPSYFHQKDSVWSWKVMMGYLNLEALPMFDWFFASDLMMTTVTVMVTVKVKNCIVVNKPSLTAIIIYKIRIMIVSSYQKLQIWTNLDND